MKPKVYLETSLISYLAARPSRDVSVLNRQLSTQEWWHTRRNLFDLYTSQAVLRECGKGDPAEAHKRLQLLSEALFLPLTDEITAIATRLVAPGPFPKKAEPDAVHLATATVYGCEFLLTWNFTHINNARIKRAATRIIESYGYQATTVCSPDELMGTGDEPEG